MKRALTLVPALMLTACMGARAPAPAPVPELVATPEEAPAAPVEEAAIVAPPPPPPEPARLEGLNPIEVQALMGEPSLVRRDAHVQVMLFEAQACVFEVIFYEPSPDAHFRVDTLNARDRRGLDTDLQTCLMQVLPDGQWQAEHATGQ